MGKKCQNKGENIRLIVNIFSTQAYYQRVENLKTPHCFFTECFLLGDPKYINTIQNSLLGTN